MTTFQLLERMRIEPLLSPRRTLPGDAHIQVMSASYSKSGSEVSTAGGADFEYVCFLVCVGVGSRQSFCVEEVEVSPLRPGVRKDWEGDYV